MKLDLIVGALRMLMCCGLVFVTLPPAHAIRIKQITDLEGVSGLRGMGTDGVNVFIVDKEANLSVVRTYTPGGAEIGIPLQITGYAEPWGVTFDGLSYWITDDQTNHVVQFDLVGTEVSTFPVGAGELRGIVWDGSSLWVAYDAESMICQYSTAGELLETIALPSDADGLDLAWDGRSLWVSVNRFSSTWGIFQFSPTGTLLTEGATYNIRGTRIEGLTWRREDEILQGLAGRTFVEMDTVGQLDFGKMMCPTPGTDARGATWDQRLLWLTDDQDEKLHQINPVTCEVVATLDSCRPDPYGIAADGTGLLWMIDRTQRGLHRIDPSLSVNHCVAECPLPPQIQDPKGMTWDGQRLWVADGLAGRLRSLEVTDGGGTITCQIGSESIAVATTVEGVAWDGSRLWYVEAGAEDRIVPADGSGCFFRPTIQSMNLYGVAFDGTHLSVVNDSGNGVLPCRLLSSQQPVPPSVLLGLNGFRFSSGEIVRANVRAIGGSESRQIDFFLWITQPNGMQVRRIVQRDLVLGPPIDLTRTVFQLSARNGLLFDPGLYIVGARILDSATGLTLSRDLDTFVVQ